jgi:hypothetical protein
VIEKDIEWIDARIAGGDRLREEWQRSRPGSTTGEGAAGGSI